MRLIDADLLEDEVMHLFICITGNPKQHTVVNSCKESFRNMIEEQPTVEAVPAVRCKECKHSDLPSVMTMKYGKPGTLTCHNKYSPCNNRNVNKNDFCSYGEECAE